MREIGSEFWKPRKHYIGDNETYYLSGRTALDVIIRDAKESYGIEFALLPSYCCHSMIEPFLINDINVRFYDVYVADDGMLTADVPPPIEHEMLYIMKYFGDTNLRYEGEGGNLCGWVTTVEDLTHSCFSISADKNDASTVADYWFVSYRKWFAVEGITVAGKRNGKLHEATKGRNEAYYKLRNEAYDLKQRYMDKVPVDKQEFLGIFGEAEKMLNEGYRNCGVGYEEIHCLFQFMDQLEEVKFRRRKNTKALIEGLAGIGGIKVFVDFRDVNNCPLFVPVVVENEKRDTLRKHLISKDIYCPVHWPMSNQHSNLSDRAKKIYRQELSLICDQRYGKSDMERIVKEIKNFYM